MRRKTSECAVLLISADSGEGGMGSMEDAVWGRRLAAAGVRTSALYVSDFKASMLNGFQVVVLLRAPIPGHPVDDLEAWRHLQVALHRFVARGGGLLVMFTECYGKTVGPLNELLAPWNMRLYFNELESPLIRQGFFPRFPEGAVVPFSVAAGSPIGEPGQALDVFIEGGHGAQHLTCRAGAGSVRWQTVLEGGADMMSRGYPHSYVNTSEEDWSNPVACAAAEVDRGRVVVFPGSAPFWWVNPYIWRFEGRLLEQQNGAGRKFLLALLRWLSDTPRNRTLSVSGQQAAREKIRPEWLIKPERFSFRTVEPKGRQALLTARPRKVWIGRCPLRKKELSARARMCREQAYAAMMPMADYTELTEPRWKQGQARVEAVSDEQSIPIWPGLELLDGEGMRTVSYTTGAWPHLQMQYPNSTLLEAVWLPYQGSAAILRTPTHNRLPPQRYGGFNLLEWEPGEAWWLLYRRLVASKQFVSPVVIRDADCEGGPDTWVLHPRSEGALNGLRTSRHTTFVSEGPRLMQFAFEGGELIDDEWEGHWLSLKPGGTVAVRITLSAETPLQEVVLWDGEQVLARFAPATRRWTRSISFTAERDYALHVTATDTMGRRLLASFPLYTRLAGFWGHVGGDNMNNYVNAMRPARHGFLGVGARVWEPFGFVTLGQGWGDYLRMAPALPYSDFMPRQEISFTLGSFREHHPSSVVFLQDGRAHYLNDHRRVFAYCGADGQHYTDELAGEQLENTGRVQQTWHGQKMRPTRLLQQVPGVRARDEYFVWRWAPYEPIVVEVDKVLEFDSQDVMGDELILASNTHQLQEGLRLTDLSRRAHKQFFAEVPSTPMIRGHKEWDNSHYASVFDSGAGHPFIPGASGAWQIDNGGLGAVAFVPLGPKRSWSLRLFRNDREGLVFIRTKITRRERAAGRVQVRYALMVDATEQAATAFDAVLNKVQGQGRQRSLTIDARNKHFPLACALPERAPNEKVHLVLRGLPPGTYEARTEQRRLLFRAQPVGGVSMHQLPASATGLFYLEKCSATLGGGE